MTAREMMAKFKGLFRRPDTDEVSVEIESHLHLLTERYVQQGMAPEVARLAARRQFGNLTQLEETRSEMQTFAAVSTFWRDMRYGIRQLRAAPVFTAMAILSLALGIGANTAMFQLIDAVRLRMLPVVAPHELAEVRMADTRGVSGGRGSASYPTVTYRIWEQIRDRQQAFSGIFAWHMENVNLAEGGEVRPARMLYAGGEIFRTLGVQPVVGRAFTAQDDQRGCGAPALVLAHGFWQREYGGSPNAIGRTIRISGHAFEIAGVMPAGFFGLEVGRSFDLALPVCAIPLVRGNNVALDGPMWWFTVTGRLRPGWSIERASAHTQAISAGVFEGALPGNYPPAKVKDFLASRLNTIPAGSGVSQLREKYGQALWFLLAIAALVLLTACMNLASLLLARAASREREIAVRQSLGASRGRLIRQLLTESLLLAMAGAALGAVLAQSLSRVLVAFLSTGADPVFLDLTLDWRVMAFAAGTAVLTCIIFGLAPALLATRVDLAVSMKEAGRGTTPGSGRVPLRRILVTAQVAFSLVLVASAMLFSRSLVRLMTTDMGFEPRGVLTATVVFQRLNLPPERLQPFKDDLMERVRRLPGVQAAAFTGMVPLRGFGSAGVHMAGEDAAQSQRTNLSRVGPGYFATLGIRLLAGREFGNDDRLGAPAVAIVNEAFARRLGAGVNPLGRRVVVGAIAGSPEMSYEVVGLVRDTKYGELREEFAPIVYTAPAQDANWGPGMQLLIRSRITEADTVAAVRNLLNQVHPSITVSFQGFGSLIESTILRERLVATLSVIFGALALVLACIGLFGLLSYTAASRTNEIGIRMALGAARAGVFWLILREGVLLVLVGIGIGLPAVLTVTRLAPSLLFGVAPADFTSLGASALLLLSAALAGGYLPSYWATRVVPLVALRRE